MRIACGNEGNLPLPHWLDKTVFASLPVPVPRKKELKKKKKPLYARENACIYVTERGADRVSLGGDALHATS